LDGRRHVGDQEVDVSHVKLEHVYLSVTDLDRTLAFYRRLLPDWIIRWEGGPEDRWVHFGPPGEGQPGYLSIAEQRDGQPFTPYQRIGPQHVGFAHPDVDGLIRRLEPELKPTDTVDDGRYRRAYFDDPDGIELEFVQAL
jgi:catechol 2,3-dioxygenase-like lactoylglutathione lyase family enzyme